MPDSVLDMHLSKQGVDCKYDYRDHSLRVDDDRRDLRITLHGVDPGALLDALVDTGLGVRPAVIAKGLYALAQDIDEAFDDPKTTALADLLCRFADLVARGKHDDMALVHAAIEAEGRP